VFKKCVPDINSSFKTAGLMFSIAGDASYVGPTVQSFRQNIFRLQQSDESCATAKQGPYSLTDLALMCLVHSSNGYSQDGLAQCHYKGAIPFLQNIIDQHKQVLEKFSKTTPKKMERDDARGEFLCCNCKRSLGNLVIMDKS